MLRKLRGLFQPDHREGERQLDRASYFPQASDSLGVRCLADKTLSSVRVLVLLETLVQDTRYGFRQLAKAPAVVAVAVLSLTLGIGATTADFTLIRAIIYQSLPAHDPGRLVLFYDGISTGVYNGGEIQSNEFSYPFWLYLQKQHDSFESLSAFHQSNERVTLHMSGTNDTGLPQQATVHLVSGYYFDVLGVGSSAGRVLVPSDDSLSAPRVAVLSYSTWRERFNLDPTVLGREVVLNGAAFAIIGVAERTFFGERIQIAPDFWLPLSAQSQVLQRESWLDSHDVYWLNFIARMKPGVTLASAQSEMNLRLHQFYLQQAGTRISPEVRRKIEGTRIRLTPGGAGISGLRYMYSKPLHILLAVVCLVLLIACANIATLLLARALTRRQEFVTRLALGASRPRLLRQVLTESILLAVLGGIAGAAFAWWSVKLLVVYFHITPVVRLRPDFTLLGFAFTLSVFTGLLFGILPALKFSRLGDVPRRSSIGKFRFRAPNVLIAVQVALSLVLLFGAGLLAHSFLMLLNQNIGFQRDNVLIIKTDARLAGYQSTELVPLYRELGERLSELPGVVSASICRFTPESGNSSSSNFSIEGYVKSRNDELRVYTVPVGPRFFETLGIPLLAGRTIDSRDTTAAPTVAVVNQTFARQYLHGRNPLGQHISLGTPFKAPGAEIVGVVSDSKYYDIREQAKPMAFFSLWQKPLTAFEIVVRTAAAPSEVGANARQALKQLSSQLPVLRTTTLSSQIEETLNQQKLVTGLCSIFGFLALLLASIGIYGTLAYSVAGKTCEIGIRMAHGAQYHDIVWTVLSEALVVVAIGLAVGVPFALGATRWLNSFLFGVPKIDPIAIAGATILIFAVAFAAAYLPARRAARIEPLRALRHE